MMRKTILITGSSRGIGRAIALNLYDRNYNVIINYKKEHEKARQVVDKLRSRGLNALAIQADISKFEQVQSLYKKIEETFGPVDILVNNAGIGNIKLAQDISVEDWREIFANNVDGMFFCTKLALDKMIKRQTGTIVNISSVWGQTGAAMESHYSATKGAIISYSKALAKELAPSNIRVNVVAPGGIITDMTLALGKNVLDEYAQEVPLGRMGYPEEIADLVNFLISDKAKYITGQVIGVNGGYYM